MNAAEPRTLRVRRFDPPWRWQVQSETDPDRPHLVDLTRFPNSTNTDANGECSCKHFACRLAPLLRDGAKPSPATRCKHIRAAEQALLITLKREALQAAPKGTR